MADTPTPPTDDAPARAHTPLAARVAILVMWIMAGLLLLISALSWLATERSTKGGLTADQRQILAIALLPYVVLALLLGLSAWGLSRRHAWARWTGLGGALMLFALLLLAMLGAGAVGVPSLLMLLLSMVACIALISRSTAEWIPRLRGGN